MKKKLLLLLYLSPLVAFSQDLIKTKEGVDIPCRLQSTSAQIIKYINSNNLQSDSIITENVTELIYKDTLRVFVYPSADREKMELLDEANYKVLFGTKDYAKILHSKTILNDVAFIGTTNNLTLDSKKKLAISLATYKAEKGIYWEITAHTDTIGKAATNLIKSDEKATVFKNYLEVQGFDIAHLSAIGKGETEPAFFKAGETIKNKRIEIRATKIDKVSILYWETYVPPKVIIPERVMVQPVETTTSLPTPSEIPTTTYIKPKKKNIFSVSLGAEMNQVLGSNTSSWKSEEGIGVLRSLGASLNINFRFRKALGIVMQTGFSQSEVLRKYVTEGELQFTSNDKLQRIPIQLGFRIYPFANFYIQPNVGGQLLNLVSNTSDTHPNGKTNYTTSGLKLGYGGLVGYEVHLKNVFVDISAQYQIINNKDFYGSAEGLNLAGLRVGIGFDSK
jgi:outer membrane protein OmpA-like peptidoglycan-associated protein